MKKGKFKYHGVHDSVLLLHNSSVCRPSTGMSVGFLLCLSTRDMYVGLSTGSCRFYRASTSKMGFDSENTRYYHVFQRFTPTCQLFGLVMFKTG